MQIYIYVLAASASFGLFGAAKDTSAEKKDALAGMMTLLYCQCLN
jgi:hypothetical protein